MQQTLKWFRKKYIHTQTFMYMYVYIYMYMCVKEKINVVKCKVPYKSPDLYGNFL